MEITDDFAVIMKDPKQLVYLCKKHDARAQRELYELYKCRLMGICRRYAKSREEAQDVLQEAFIKIFTKFHQLDDYERLDSWMIRITINTAINYYHVSKKNVFDDISDVQTESGDYELIIEKVSDEYLIQLINALPDGCRLVFNLFVIEGYSHAEIGAMLSISESTSRSQLVYAKSILKGKLKSAGVLGYERYV
jgi:RNA polymerase sigma-70 factor (ECF subfamily)